MSRRIASEERAHPHLFVVLERARPLAGGARHLLVNIDRVSLGRGTMRVARRVVDDGKRTLLLEFPDLRMSRNHARIERAQDGFRLADTGSTNGVRLNGRRVDGAILGEGDLIEVGGTFFRFRPALAAPFQALADVDLADHRGVLARFGTMVPALARRLEDLARAVRSGGPCASVLIEGEAGTGKAVLARAPRRDRTARPLRERPLPVDP
jgi:hypothetical protein